VEFVDDQVAGRALRQHEAFSSRAGETVDASPLPNSAKATAPSSEKPASAFRWLPTWQLSWAKQNVRPPVYHWQPGASEEEQMESLESPLQSPQQDSPKRVEGDVSQQASGNDRSLK
jgi:hypothetical protein